VVTEAIIMGERKEEREAGRGGEGGRGGRERGREREREGERGGRASDQVGRYESNNEATKSMWPTSLSLCVVLYSQGPQ
jgi:hypothetical protein